MVKRRTPDFRPFSPGGFQEDFFPPSENFLIPSDFINFDICEDLAEDIGPLTCLSAVDWFEYILVSTDPLIMSMFIWNMNTYEMELRIKDAPDGTPVFFIAFADPDDVNGFLWAACFEPKITNLNLNGHTVLCGEKWFNEMKEKHV